MLKILTGVLGAILIGLLIWGLAFSGFTPKVVESTAEVTVEVTRVVTVVVTPTPAPSSPSATPAAVAQAPSSGDLPLYESEGGIPYNGTDWNLDVAPDEIEVLTSGPATVAGVKLPGGTNRGSVIVFLPASSEVVRYTATGLLPGSNWHGAYRPLVADEAMWRRIAEDRVQAMMVAPNCTPGKGCKVVDVLVVGPTGKVAQWTEGGESTAPVPAASAESITPPPPPAEPATTVVQLAAGEVKLVSAGSTVAGDIEVASEQAGPWTKLYDNDGTTGLVVVLTADSWVKAPWEATVSNVDPQKVAAGMKASGCGSSCASVAVVTWPTK